MSKRISNNFGSLTSMLEKNQDTTQNLNTTEISEIPDHNQTRAYNRSLLNFLNNSKSTLLISLITICYVVITVALICFDKDLYESKTALIGIELAFLLFFGFKMLCLAIIYKAKHFWNIFDIITLILSILIVCVQINDLDLSVGNDWRLKSLLCMLRIYLINRFLLSLWKINQNYRTKLRLDKISVLGSNERIIEILNVISRCFTSVETSFVKGALLWCKDSLIKSKAYDNNIEETTEIDKMKTPKWGEFVQLSPKVIPEFEEVSVNQLPEFSFTDDSISFIPLSIIRSCENIESLDFDVFQLRETTKNKVLYSLFLYLFSDTGLFTHVHIAPNTLACFIDSVEDGYHRENPYHTSTHAADVTQFFHYLITTCDAKDICNLAYLDIVACYLSAAVHDYQHPGVNNLYLINTQDPLAILYNDKSVLENHHISAAFKLMQDPSKDIFFSLKTDERKVLRNKMISMVLATDMSRHFQDMTKFRAKFSNDCNIKDENDKLMSMELMMHSADLGNPCRPWEICKVWTDLVTQEFFNQGDKERDLGLPISNLCDRYFVNIPKSQIGFIEVIIEPTISSLSMILPRVLNEIAQNMKKNKENWKEEI